MSRQKLIAGNWKMYKTIGETVDFVKELALLVATSPCLVYLAVPFTALQAAADAAKGTSVVIGAQNMNDAKEGAYTGEVSALMIRDAGAQFVLLGHSERRHIYHESNEFINKKVTRALSEKLQPILCIGETYEQHQRGGAESVLKLQLLQSLNGVNAEQFENLVVAYEPVWAIGTNVAATPEIAQQMHRFCRGVVAEKWGSDIANNLQILYGGSVKPDNARALMANSDIDGLLVGGASLSLDSFVKIVNDSVL